jgi:hypothetical protein
VNLNGAKEKKSVSTEYVSTILSASSPKTYVTEIKQILSKVFHIKCQLDFKSTKSQPVTQGIKEFGLIMIETKVPRGVDAGVLVHPVSQIDSVLEVFGCRAGFCRVTSAAGSWRNNGWFQFIFVRMSTIGEVSETQWMVVIGSVGL